MEVIGLMLRRTVALALIAGLALAGAPLMAAPEYAPNTVWGEVPAGAASAANAVLLDASGNVVATVPVVDGKFQFANVQPGRYFVQLTDAAAVELARSHAADLASSGVVKALFDTSRPAAAALAGSTATTGGGIGTTGWVLIGAAAAGITTAVIVTSDEDEGVMSGTR
jgi:hypothetical protein